MVMKQVIVLLALVALTFADDSCSENGKFLSSATDCEDKISSETCGLMFFPVNALLTGSDVSTRPTKCSMTDAKKAGAPTMRSVAIANCAKTCGFCCLAVKV